MVLGFNFTEVLPIHSDSREYVKNQRTGKLIFYFHTFPDDNIHFS